MCAGDGALSGTPCSSQIPSFGRSLVSPAHLVPTRVAAAATACRKPSRYDVALITAQRRQRAEPAHRGEGLCRHVRQVDADRLHAFHVAAANGAHWVPRLSERPPIPRRGDPELQTWSAVRATASMALTPATPSVVLGSGHLSRSKNKETALQRGLRSPLPDSNRRPLPYHGSPAGGRGFVREAKAPA
jgi:hypothetical protein